MTEYTWLDKLGRFNIIISDILFDLYKLVIYKVVNDNHLHYHLRILICLIYTEKIYEELQSHKYCDCLLWNSDKSSNIFLGKIYGKRTDKTLRRYSLLKYKNNHEFIEYIINIMSEQQYNNLVESHIYESNSAADVAKNYIFTLRCEVTGRTLPPVNVGM
jgi:hypothetical protein